MLRGNSLSKIIRKGKRNVIEASQDGTTVTLTMPFEGLFALLVYALSSRLTHQYIEIEINGLKKESEKTINI